jgi:flagellin-specific chaperone FliS
MAYGIREYRQQEVLGSSPLHLVVMTYDAAIQACQRRDLTQATRVVTALRDMLNFDAGEAALGLFRLYQWCLDCIRQDDYAEAAHVLSSLREAWAQVEKRQQVAVGAIAGAAGSYLASNY